MIKPSRIYLIGRYERRAEFMWYAKDLVEAGHIVTSDWILGLHEGTPQMEWAIEDLARLRASDTVIYFSDDVMSRSRFVEWGIAIGLPIVKKIIIGERETIFHMFAGVIQYNNWNEFRVKELECLESVLTLQTSVEEPLINQSSNNLEYN